MPRGESSLDKFREHAYTRETQHLLDQIYEVAVNELLAGGSVAAKRTGLDVWVRSLLSRADEYEIDHSTWQPAVMTATVFICRAAFALGDRTYPAVSRQEFAEMISHDEIAVQCGLNAPETAAVVNAVLNVLFESSLFQAAGETFYIEHRRCGQDDETFCVQGAFYTLTVKDGLLAITRTLYHSY